MASALIGIATQFSLTFFLYRVGLLNVSMLQTEELHRTPLRSDPRLFLSSPSTPLNVSTELPNQIR